MGSGNKIFNYWEASKLLLKRSYPDIHYGKQVGPIFIPETFLPSYTRAVDPDQIAEKLKMFHGRQDTMEKGENLAIDQELKKFRGNLAERNFYDELQRVLEIQNFKAVVLQGFQMMLPEIICKSGTQTGGRQESDFLVINQDFKYIMLLEVKYNLYSVPDGKDMKTSIDRGLNQISLIKTILETFFCNDIDISRWRFVGVLGYVEMSDHVKCCSVCKPFVIKSAELNDFLNKIQENLIVNFEDRNDEDYKLMIRNFLYTIFANPGPIVHNKVDQAVFETIQRHQGDYKNILFWTPSQFDLVQLNKENKPKFKNVLFTSSYSTGKTEVMKGMMKKLLKAGEKVHYIFCNIYTDKRPIQLLQIELMFQQNKELQQYRSNVHFSVVQNGNQYDLMERYPDYHTFIDEFVTYDWKDDDKRRVEMNKMKLILKVRT